MSIWKYAAAIEGWCEVHAAESENSLSTEEADELWEWLNDGH